ncbi:hypothetical protein HDV05_003817 [Chytridiales sp. JEL 0842]|nr:hypothetical protein HDV05_003817 [Chytridiales sp. JEL 0842]
MTKIRLPKIATTVSASSMEWQQLCASMAALREVESSLDGARKLETRDQAECQHERSTMLNAASSHVVSDSPTSNVRSSTLAAADVEPSPSANLRHQSNNYAHLLASFITQFRWLANIHAFDVVTHGFFTSKFPVEWQLLAEQKYFSIDDLIIVCMTGNVPSWWPESLKTYVKTAADLTLPRDVLLSDYATGVLDEEINKVPKKHGASKAAMSQKKLHEVERFSRVILHEASQHNPRLTKIIDVGAGHGYLSHNLSEHYPVVAVDFDVEQTSGSQRRGDFLKGLAPSSKPQTKSKGRQLAPGKEVPLRKTAAAAESTFPSSHNITYVTQHISEDSLTSMLNKMAQDNRDRVMLVGLHACGDLSASAILHTFAKVDSVKSLAVVPCCFNLLTEPESPTMPTHQHGFPLSSAVRDLCIKFNLTLGHRTRNLACQTFDKFDKEGITQLVDGHYKRSMLDSIMWDLGLDPPKSAKSSGVSLYESLNLPQSTPGEAGKPLREARKFRLGKLPPEAYEGDAVAYILAAMEKMGMKDQITESQLKSIVASEKYRNTERQVFVLYLIRSLLARVVESLLLLDRFIYLEEVREVLRTKTPAQAVNVKLLNLFDVRESPRNMHAMSQPPESTVNFANDAELAIQITIDQNKNDDNEISHDEEDEEYEDDDEEQEEDDKEKEQVVKEDMVEKGAPTLNGGNSNFDKIHEEPQVVPDITKPPPGNGSIQKPASKNYSSVPTGKGGGKNSSGAPEPNVMKSKPYQDDNSSETHPYARSNYPDNSYEPPPQQQPGRKQRGHLNDPNESRLSANKSAAGKSSNMSIGTSRYPNAREISETVGSKSKEISQIFAVVVINSVIIIIANEMRQGLRLQLSPMIVQFAGGVVIQLALLISNLLTIQAMDIAASIYLGSLLMRKEGYSMAVCGFMQAKSYSRLSFTNQLSLNSTCRKHLQRAALLWLVVQCGMILSPIGSIGVISERVRAVGAPIDCIVFDSTVTTDRGYPTMQTTAGVAEFIFGDALGCMRSQREECLLVKSGSTFVFGPQIQGAIGSGNTIIGPGYQAIVSTSCNCGNLTDPTSNLNGEINNFDRNSILGTLNSTQLPFIYMSSVVNNSETQGYAQSIILGNTQLCGGYINSYIPICKTTITNATDVMVSSTFLTDGTTASIALVNSQTMSTLEKQTLTMRSLGRAMNNIFTPGTVLLLPSTVPGMLNALLYWTSRELAAISPTLLEPGIETFAAMILRAGIQRTFAVEGTLCPQNTFLDGAANIYLQPLSIIAIYTAMSIQLFMTLFALVLACTWYFVPSPITPGIRILRDPAYFTSLLGDSPFNAALQGTNNAQNHVIWQALDTVVRIGETLEPLDEYVGQIKLERPKLVKPLINGRMYT